MTTITLDADTPHLPPLSIDLLLYKNKNIYGCI
jgi:hypothetical protein